MDWEERMKGTVEKNWRGYQGLHQQMKPLESEAMVEGVAPVGRLLKDQE